MTPRKQKIDRVSFSLARFESLGALVDYATAVPGTDYAISQETARHARAGDLSRVAKSDAYLARLEAALPVAYTRGELVLTVSGALPDVPAYLSGAPANMRRRTPRATPAPICIVCDVATSESTSNDIIARRGAATLALLRRLEMAGHPVEVWAGYAADHKGGPGSGAAAIVTRIDSAPLDLARAAWVLGSPAMQRQLYFRTGRHMTGAPAGHIAWPFPDAGSRWCIPTATELHRDVYRAALGLAPGAPVFVLPPATQFTAAAFETEESTLAWITAAFEAAVQASGLETV